jgi:hypothetical protein
VSFAAVAAGSLLLLQLLCALKNDEMAGFFLPSSGDAAAELLAPLTSRMNTALPCKTFQ